MNDLLLTLADHFGAHLYDALVVITAAVASILTAIGALLAYVLREERRAA